MLTLMAIKKDTRESIIFNFDELRGWDDLSVNINSDPNWVLICNGEINPNIEIYVF